MSQSTQISNADISSIVQPGAPPFPFPDPLPGDLILDTKARVGAYSDVYKGTWRYNGQEQAVCIKCLRNTAPDVDPSCPDLTPAERFERRLRRETSIWIRTKHDNVLPFLGYQIKDEEPRLVSPWMSNGSLDRYLAVHPNVSDMKKLQLLHQATEGLAYLHGSTPSIAHGDLKPENILITDGITAVLCDMGVSRVMLEGHTGLTTSGSAAGSTGFQAKELIMGEALPTPTSDMYAMGGVILEAMSGKKPFHKARTHGMVILAITTDKMCTPEDHPELAADDLLWSFLRQCWSPEPDGRPTAAKALEELGNAIQQRQTRTQGPR